MSYHVNPIARSFPRLGARSVGAVPTIKELTVDQRTAIVTRSSGKDAGAFFKSCYTDPIGPRDLAACMSAAQKQVATLRGDQLAFYNSCMAQRGADVPVLLQHNACFAEAKKLTPGAAPPAASTPSASMPEFAPPVPSGGGTPKWMWVAGAAGVAVLAFVLLKPAKT